MSNIARLTATAVAAIAFTAGCGFNPFSSSNTATRAARADKITICHATGSDTNPYVEITVSVNGLNGHGDHPNDIIPAPDGGCPMASAGEGEGDGNGDGGKITICHATGSDTNPYVEITVDVNGLNGHGDHPNDIIPAPADGCPTAGEGEGEGSVGGEGEGEASEGEGQANEGEGEGQANEGEGEGSVAGEGEGSVAGEGEGEGGAQCSCTETLCGDTCADLSQDHDNCGQCGNVCGANDTCVAGQCQPAPCMP